DNELPMTYLDQVTNFITANTQGASLGETSQNSTGSDPLGTEARYRPGQSVPTPPAMSSRPKVLPQTSYLSIKAASLRTVQKKIEELNQQLTNEGSQDLAMAPPQLQVLGNAMKPLEEALADRTYSENDLASGLDLIMHAISKWPTGQLLPLLDLLRLLAAATPLTAKWRSSNGTTFIEVLEESKVFADPDRSNNIMLAVRAFSNVFEKESGVALADESFEKVHALVKSSANYSNRNLAIAIATLYVNYAVLFTSKSHCTLQSSIDRGKMLLDDLTDLIKIAVDSEAIYRALVAVGTLIGLGDKIQAAAKQDFDVEGALRKAESTAREPRVKGIVSEIRASME
ncbi:MAG: hypothetical protein Q9214_006706, partial [Letrouitia sp. 1 TL-2023]